MKPKSARGDWAKQLRFDMVFAEKTLIKQGFLGVMFVVHTKDEMYVIATPWTNDDEKAAYLDTVRAYCTAHDAMAVTYFAEAWIRHLIQAPNETDGEYQARIDAVRPRDAEDRREMVLVMTMFRDDAGERQVVSDSKEIVRRANGKPEGLQPFRLNDGGWDVFGGTIVEVFPQWPPSPAERIAAQSFLKASGVIEVIGGL